MREKEKPLRKFTTHREKLQKIGIKKIRETNKIKDQLNMMQNLIMIMTVIQ